MHELEANADSVNFLINALCSSIARQNGIQQQASVTKLKVLSYEILLKKSSRPATKTIDDFEPQKALDVQIFAAKLKVNGNPEKCTKFAAFDEHLAVIEQDQYFTDGAGRGVLQLLLQLQGNISDAPDERQPPHLLVPGPFTLHASYKNNPHYPINANDIIGLPAPKFFKGIQSLKSSCNPYLPKFIFDGEADMLARIEKKFAAATEPQLAANKNSCSFTGMTRCLWGDSMRINVKAFRLFADCGRTPHKTHKNKPSSPLKTPQFKFVPTTTVSDCREEPQRCFSWNWENLGNFGIIRSKPFASESNVVLHLQNLHQQAMGNKFSAKIVTQQQFLQDLKSLTVGIQSDTFVHNENIIFRMQPDITIDGVLPATTKNFIGDFLECGTCYKRLQTMILKRNYKLMFDGFMFKALCSAIDEYLITFRQYVFALNDTYLMQFYKRMKKMINQISNLSYTLAIHPNVDASVKPPMGSQFLGYLYREIMRLTEKDYITLLVFILKRCCHVYFKHFQKWIFYGILDDPSNELFIGFVDHYRQNTKYFYDRAYVVRKESVPGFFQNFEDQILQCGKYTMLLKACKPNHPFFDLECPSISVCLTFDELQALESTCSKYFERARELCGKPITIRQVFESRAEQKRKFFQMVSQRSRANMEKWTVQQHALAIIAAEQKKKRLEELTTQLQDAKKRKVDERRINVEMELKLLKEAERLEEQRLLRENINLRKRIEYYQELSDMMQIDASEGSDKLITDTLTLPSNKQMPHTPTSTETDFESCEGDEDVASEYAECLSDEFMLRFEQAGDELRELCLEDIEVSDNNNHTQHELMAADSTSNVATTVGTNMKRSASDYLNSNDLPSLVMNIVQKNREKALSGANMKECLAKDLSSLKVTTDVTNIVVLTEAQRNKLKVLSQEFASLTNNTQAKSLPDINLNVLHVDSKEGEMSELQRNRKRMMQNDLFSEYNKEPLADRKLLNLDLLETERSRNRRKVLESEFNILTGESQSTTTFVVECPVTPMSTTSDLTPNTVDGLDRCLLDAELKVNKGADLENGNFTEKSSLSPLKINVSAATLKQLSQRPMDDAIDASKSMQINTGISEITAPTPECALNTAGIMAKRGFDFRNQQEQEDKKRKQQQAATVDAPIQNSHLHEQSDELFPHMDYSTPYKRCVQLIESNFKCPTRSQFFRLNMATKRTEDDANQSRENMRKNMSKQLNLNSMSVITLTEFLQKSMIIPMSIHLEIVNNEVMRMFLEDLKILGHFKSLRNYFLLMDGEFGAFICDGIIGKLENGATPEQLLNYQMLHSVLENALGSSIIGNDKNAANLSFIVSDVPAMFDLSSPLVLNNLSLSYRVDWPLNLILSPETLEHYSIIFKHLLKVRRISWILERAYQILKEVVKRHGKIMLMSPQYRHIQQIRHKFYHFVHALQNHITSNALQASWKTFKDNLLHAKSIEDIYHKHAIYVKRILFLCMLNRQSKEFNKTIESIFHISLRFYNNLKSREFRQRSSDGLFVHPRYEKLAADEYELDKFVKFTIYLGNKIVRHGYQEEIGEFISLINYNRYYHEKPT